MPDWTDHFNHFNSLNLVKPVNDEYPDNNQNGIPDAFENRRPILEILHEIYGDGWAKELPHIKFMEHEPVFKTNQNIWLGENNKPMVRDDYGKLWLILGEGQVMPLERARRLGIIDEKGIPFYDKKK